MGMCGERNTWLSCIVLLHMLNITPNMDRRGRRAQEGSEQCACRGLERDTEPASRRRQRQGPGARASEQGELKKEVNSMHVGLKVTKSKQEREDDGRALEPEPRKGLIRTQTRGEQTAQLELDSSLVNRFEVWSLASS